MSKAEYRPMTELEMRQVLALVQCRLPPASMTKRFSGNLAYQAQHTKGITERQAAYLLVSCYRFRRQMPKDLVPEEPPPGYETPKQYEARCAVGIPKPA